MTIEPSDYWQLRARDADLQREQVALALTQQRLIQARERRQALWGTLVAKYQLDPAKNYVANDEECSLTANEDQAAP